MIKLKTRRSYQSSAGSRNNDKSRKSFDNNTATQNDLRLTFNTEHENFAENNLNFPQDDIKSCDDENKNLTQTFDAEKSKVSKIRDKKKIRSLFEKIHAKKTKLRERGISKYSKKGRPVNSFSESSLRNEFGSLLEDGNDEGNGASVGRSGSGSRNEMIDQCPKSDPEFDGHVVSANMDIVDRNNNSALSLENNQILLDGSKNQISLDGSNNQKSWKHSKNQISLDNSNNLFSLDDSNNQFSLEDSDSHSVLKDSNVVKGEVNQKCSHYEIDTEAKQEGKNNNLVCKRPEQIHSGGECCEIKDTSLKHRKLLINEKPERKDSGKESVDSRGTSVEKTVRFPSLANPDQRLNEKGKVQQSKPRKVLDFLASDVVKVKLKVVLLQCRRTVMRTCMPPPPPSILALIPTWISYSFPSRS